MATPHQEQDTTPSSSSPSSSSSLLRLSGLKTTQLPSPTAPAEALQPFLTSLLQEAIPLISSASPPPPPPPPSPPSGPANPKPLWKPKGTKTFAESTAPVHLTERTIPSSSSSSSSSSSTKGDTWACRRSLHADAPRKGTASWAEFVRCIRDEHAATEEAFTPTVVGHRVGVRWEGAAGLGPVEMEVEAGAGAGAGGREKRWWGGFRMVVVEMMHKVPAPLKKRVFPVLQVICSAYAGRGEAGEEKEEEEFLVISVPVSDWGSSTAEGEGEEWKGRAELSAEKGVVVGAYVSVERVRRVVSPPQTGEGGGGGGGGGEQGQIEWVMATASDAKGVLPMWVQTRAVPGAIAKDVSLFLGWLDRERGEDEC